MGQTPWREGLEPWLGALANDRPTPAGGALAWITLAGAAALAAKLAGLDGRNGAGLVAAARRFAEAARHDAEGFAAARTPEERAAFLERCVKDLEGVVRFVAEVRRGRRACGRPGLRADWDAVERLAEAAWEVLWENARLNEEAWGTGLGGRLRTLRPCRGS